MSKKLTKSFLVELDSKQHTQLKQLAATESVSMADIVRKCISRRIDERNKKVIG